MGESFLLDKRSHILNRQKLDWPPVSERPPFDQTFFERTQFADPSGAERGLPRFFSLGNESSPKPDIRVVGIGGAGCNAIVDSPFQNIAVCATTQDTRLLGSMTKVLVTEGHLEFLRSTSFRMARSISHDLKKDFETVLGEPDLVFVFAGLGGDTGSYVAPLLTDVCRKRSALTISSVPLPFSVEGKDRKDLASSALVNIREASDLLITYPNDQLLQMVPNLPLRKAFSLMNRIMMVPLLHLEKVLTKADLEPLRRAFLNSRWCRLGVGTGAGERREALAVEEAFSSPWFDFPKESVMAAILTISSGKVEAGMLREVVEDVALRLPYSRIGFSGIEDRTLGEKVKVMAILGQV